MREVVQDHENRIQSLEIYRQEQELANSELKLQLAETEKTVLKESGKQQELSQQLLNHVLKNDVYAREHRRYTHQQIWKLLGLLVGSGGLIYLLVDSFINR
ncbi:hypothetical protein [Halalkalibacter oceani]|uniref:hypothetical protein n=1 Tax=Halalkalibacter oceani TaxID=1653776 RepID=UPI003399FEE2